MSESSRGHARPAARPDEAASSPSTIHLLLLEPRARYRKALIARWNRALELSQDPAPPVLCISERASAAALSGALEQKTFEAVVFPLLDQHASIERAWRMLETAGYSIGYLFHVTERAAGPGRRSRPAATRRVRIPYLCKTRFGCHQHILILLGLIDMAVLEVRPPDDTLHERYRKILNRIEEGFWDVGPDLQVAYVNRAFKEMVEESAPVGKNLLDFFDPEDRPRIASVLAEQQEGIIIPLTMRLRSAKNGRKRVVHIDPSPRFGWGGQYLGGSALVRDVSGRDPATDHSLRQERELYTLYVVASTLARASGLHELVAAASEKIREQLAVDATCAWVRRDDGELEAIEAHGVGGASPDDRLLVAARRWCETIPEGKPALIVRDATRSRDSMARTVHELGFRSMAGIPLQDKDGRIGYLWLACHDTSLMTRGWVSLFISIGHQFSLAVANAMHVEARLHEEARRKVFYREAVFALTNGKLSLLERADTRDVTRGERLGGVLIRSPEDVRTCRETAETLLSAAGFTPDRCFDAAMCVSEAATNVLLHGCGGTMTLLSVPDQEGAVRIVMEDHGPGINFSQLPNALLKRGYSTAVSMGLGYTLILEMMDAVYLTTDSEGTLLVMEAHAQPVNAELEAWLAKVSD